MPLDGAFAVTALSAAVCTIIMGLFAKTPFAMAPGMGLNTFSAYPVCAYHGFHWREALAAAFLSALFAA